MTGVLMERRDLDRGLGNRDDYEDTGKQPSASQGEGPGADSLSQPEGSNPVTHNLRLGLQNRDSMFLLFWLSCLWPFATVARTGYRSLHPSIHSLRLRAPSPGCSQMWGCQSGTLITGGRASGGSTGLESSQSHGVLAGAYAGPGQG